MTASERSRLDDRRAKPQRPELTLAERRERRRLRREKQRADNVHRAAKMHKARLAMEAEAGAVPINACRLPLCRMFGMVLLEVARLILPYRDADR